MTMCSAFMCSCILSLVIAVTLSTDAPTSSPSFSPIDHWLTVYFGVYNVSDAEVAFVGDNRADFVKEFVHSVWSGFGDEPSLSADDLAVDYYLRNFSGSGAMHLVCDDDDDDCTVLAPLEMVSWHYGNDSVPDCSECSCWNRIDVGFHIECSEWVCRRILDNSFRGQWRPDDVFSNQTAVEQYVTTAMRQYLEDEAISGRSSVTIGYTGYSNVQSIDREDTASPSTSTTTSPVVTDQDWQTTSYVISGGSHYALHFVLYCTSFLILCVQH